MPMSLDEGACASCNDFNCEWCYVPTCTRSLILNQQVLLFFTFGLLQLTFIAVGFSIRATYLKKMTKLSTRQVLNQGSLYLTPYGMFG